MTWTSTINDLGNMADKTTFENLEEIRGKATNEEQSLPLTDKLQLLDKEIRLLHNYCVKFGLNSKEIECCAEPFLKERGAMERKKWWRRVFYMSVVVALIACLLCYDPTYRYICVIGKLSSMKLLPYWDWTTEFDNDCFVENPYYVEDVLTKEDCDVCENVSGTRLANVSQDDMANNYLFNEIPVVVTDATRNWPIDLKNFDSKLLKEVYLNDKNFGALQSCTFDVYSPDIESVEQLFSRIEDKELNHWQGYWENCEPAAAKSIRKFYKRPYFLPPMAESAPENWIFTSYSIENKTKSSMKWETISFGGSATWITQIKGKSRIVLSPQAPCDEICDEMSATLKPGETLVFGNRLWHFKRKPFQGGESISLAATVGWDQI